MNNPKKILFTTENVSWGGSELLWSRTVAELSQFSFSTAICVPEKLKLPQEVLALKEDNKIQIFTHSNAILPLWKRIINRFTPYRARFKVTNLRHSFIHAFNPDLIIMNQGFNFNAVELMLFAQKNNYRYVTISQAVNESLWPNYGLREKMKLGFGNSVKNYFVSQDNLLVTQNQLGILLNNAAVIRNPFNVPFTIDLNYPISDDYNLAFVGRFDFYAKGQDVLLQALAEPKWKSRNLQVNFYGEGNDIENLKDLVEMYQLTNVAIHCHLATEEIWKKNQGLILTSRFEGLPIVIVEAMLCKRLVIVTNVSGNKELVQDNKTGFIAAAPRPEYVDEALERAWQARENWQQMGEEAKLQLIKQIPENPALIFANKLQTILNNL